MKKSISFLFISLFALSIMSCKKDYNCVCKVDGVVDNTLFIPDAAKDDAETTCDLYQITGEVCELEDA
jgi:hypothetical protein